MSTSGGAAAIPSTYSMEPLAAGGELLQPRLGATGGFAMTAGVVLLGPAQIATKTETINNVSTILQGVAAAGGTYAAYGVYQVDALGNCTLVASTPSDLTLWTVTFASLQAATTKKALSVPLAKVAGLRYAVGKLFTGTTAPTVLCPNSSGGFGDANLLQPFRAAQSAGGQVALPATILVGALANCNQAAFDALLP